MSGLRRDDRLRHDFPELLPSGNDFPELVDGHDFSELRRGRPRRES
jgi:hypothetical protein